MGVPTLWFVQTLFRVKIFMSLYVVLPAPLFIIVGVVVGRFS